MGGIKKGTYKYCIAPLCGNTTVKAPDKIFFCVPTDIQKRKMWCKEMKRDVIGPKSCKYVCEDHFDIENDTENLVQYRLVGGTLRLKRNIYPHKFDCQKLSKPKAKIERKAQEKKRGIEFSENLLKIEEPSTSSQPSSFEDFEMVVCDKVYAEDPAPDVFNESEQEYYANKIQSKKILKTENDKIMAQETDSVSEDINFKEPTPDDHVNKIRNKNLLTIKCDNIKIEKTDNLVPDNTILDDHANKTRKKPRVNKKYPKKLKQS